MPSIPYVCTSWYCLGNWATAFASPPLIRLELLTRRRRRRLKHNKRDWGKVDEGGREKVILTTCKLSTGKKDLLTNKAADWDKVLSYMHYFCIVTITPNPIQKLIIYKHFSIHFLWFNKQSLWPISKVKTSGGVHILLLLRTSKLPAFYTGNKIG